MLVELEVALLTFYRLFEVDVLEKKLQSRTKANINRPSVVTILLKGVGFTSPISLYRSRSQKNQLAFLLIRTEPLQSRKERYDTVIQTKPQSEGLERAASKGKSVASLMTS